MGVAVGVAIPTNSVMELAVKLVSQTLPEASMARPRGLLRSADWKPLLGEKGAPELEKAESELPSRLAIQTRFQPSMAIWAGPLRPPPE